MDLKWTEAQQRVERCLELLECFCKAADRDPAIAAAAGTAVWSLLGSPTEPTSAREILAAAHRKLLTHRREHLARLSRQLLAAPASAPGERVFGILIACWLSCLAQSTAQASSARRAAFISGRFMEALASLADAVRAEMPAASAAEPLRAAA